jgi:hypothetical protein
MKLAAACLLALTFASPEMRYFRYQRPLATAPQKDGQACLVLDADTFAHSAEGLADLRLYRAGAEIPYLIHRAAGREAEARSVRAVNVGARGGQTVFDVEMPPGRYRDLTLDLNARNFVATVYVSGSQTQSGVETRIGSYTIFDLTQQRLGRGVDLHLPESDFRFLHFRIAGRLPVESIVGVKVPDQVLEKPRYLPVAEASQGAVKEKEQRFTVPTPAHLPVDRIVFVPASQPAFFNRSVRVMVEPVSTPPDSSARQEMIAQGSLLRMHGVEEGHRIDEERLSIDLPERSFDAPALWTIAIDSGDDAPLRMDAVRLEMAERDLCFDAVADTQTILYYGDAALTAPRYDYATLAPVRSDAMAVTAGAERANPAFQPRPDQRPFTERHPWILWFGLGGTILVLGAVALRTVKQMRN